MKTILLVLLALNSSLAFALPTAAIPFREFSKTSIAATDVNFEGIVALNNCSGSIIRFFSSNDYDQALMLTNGHCTGNFIDPGKSVIDQKERRSVYLLDPVTGEEISNLKTDRLIYATMTKTDIAIYRLENTYADLEKRFKIRALMLRNARPAPGEALEIISGYWRKNYRCALESIVPTIKEDKWSWSQSLKYGRECQTEHGSSGSPILTGAREVLGINNTGNDDGEECTMNNPCEVDENGKIIVEQGRNYGQQTQWIYSCLNAYGHFDFFSTNCLLPH